MARAPKKLNYHERKIVELRASVAGLETRLSEVDQDLANTTKAYVDLEQRYAAETTELQGQVAAKNRELSRQSAALEENRKEIDRCREELHDRDLQVARLQGYRDRVQQFDPVTERQAFFGVDRDMGREHRLADFAHMQAGTAHRSDGASLVTPAPYYRRRA